MSLLSLIVFIVILLLSTVKSKIENEQVPPELSIQNFKEFVTKMIKQQSTKIQYLLKRIQINAHSILLKIRNINQNSNTVNYKIADNIERSFSNDEHQIEAPVIENSAKTTSNELVSNSRSFNSHYATTGYGVSGNANYGASTYHHHSIGFDPINIVVSMSLLSFLLQALQGLLTRTRFPTPVVEAKSLNTMKNWLTELEKKTWKPVKINEYLKKRFYKKYLR